MRKINIIEVKMQAKRAIIKNASLPKKQSGMLLIEVLFSILIFSFGILGLVGMQAISSKNAMSAEDRTIAASLANDMVAQMWLRKSTDVTTTPPTGGTNLSTDYTAWQTKVAATPGWSNASGTVATNAGTSITTVTVNWSTAPTSKASTSTSGLVAHQYVTSFSM